MLVEVGLRLTGDPTNPWVVYQIDTTDLGDNGCPCFGDQPRIGIDSQNIYVTDDEFSINGTEFNGGEIYAFSKGSGCTSADRALRAFPAPECQWHHSLGAPASADHRRFVR